MARQTGTLLESTRPHITQHVPESPPTSKGMRGRELWRIESADACGLAWPISAAVHPSGSVLLLDQPDQFRVLCLDCESRNVSVWLELAVGEAAGTIDDPQGLCVDAQGRLYIPDAGNDRIAIWNADGRFAGCLGSSGRQPGEMAHPNDVDVDDDGFVYVADTFNRRIQKFSPEGMVCLVVDDLKQWGHFEEPVAITTDDEKNIFVLDARRNLLVKLSAEGIPLDVLPKTDSDLRYFDGPGDIRIADDGTWYISDRRNLRVQRFTVDGQRLGVLDLSVDSNDGLEGGDIALLGQRIIVPDRLHDRILCLVFDDGEKMQ